MARLTVVVGGQYGSEGKGAICAYLAREMHDYDWNIRVAGPNAGHTAYDDQGTEFKLRHIPVGAVTSNCALGIAAGSEVDLQVLMDEIELLGKSGHPIRHRLSVSPHATVLEPDHQDEEADFKLTSRIGSTGKGIGAARADRIMRNARTVAALPLADVEDFVVGDPEVLANGTHKVLVEGTQGYGLGLHTKQYPYVTSSDCRAIDFLAMAGISPWEARWQNSLRVYVVARCYPIRVAGNSGPMRRETSWELLGLPEERTTVTNKIRRVGHWDGELVAEAVQANGGHPVVRIALTMLDQRFPEIRGATTWEQVAESEGARRFIEDVESEVGAMVTLAGTSPTTVARLGEVIW